MRPHRWRCRPRREYQRSSRNARRRAGAGAAGRARAGRQRRSDTCRRGTRRGRARRGDRARGARRRRSPARRGGGQGRRLGGARLRASERAGAAARRDRRVDAELRRLLPARRPGASGPGNLDPTLMASRYGLPRMVTVCTFLPPPERPRVDAAGDGCFTTLHANSLRDALHAARRKRVDALARLAPVLSTVRGLARHLRICPSTLMSRFYRMGLPSPKTYLAGMRLLHAAYLFLNPGLSVSDVAYRLDYSSPQSFGRHLKAMLGVTAGEFRRRFPFDVSLERYVDLLVT